MKRYSQHRVQHYSHYGVRRKHEALDGFLNDDAHRLFADAPVEARAAAPMRATAASA